MAFSFNNLRYGWTILASVVLGTSIYVASNTRRRVKQIDAVEIVLGTVERCLATQTEQREAGAEGVYSVAPPVIDYNWRDVNGATQSGNNAFGWYIDRDMLDTIDDKIYDLIPYYVDTNSVAWTVNSLWTYLGIGDGVNQFTKTPTIDGNPATYGDYAKRVYIEALQERCKVLYMLQTGLGDTIPTTNVEQGRVWVDGGKVYVTQDYSPALPPHGWDTVEGYRYYQYEYQLGDPTNLFNSMVDTARTSWPAGNLSASPRNYSSGLIDNHYQYGSEMYIYLTVDGVRSRYYVGPFPDAYTNYGQYTITVTAQNCNVVSCTGDGYGESGCSWETVLSASGFGTNIQYGSTLGSVAYPGDIECPWPDHFCEVVRWMRNLFRTGRGYSYSGAGVTIVYSNAPTSPVAIDTNTGYLMYTGWTTNISETTNVLDNVFHYCTNKFW